MKPDPRHLIFILTKKDRNYENDDKSIVVDSDHLRGFAMKQFLRMKFTFSHEMSKGFNFVKWDSDVDGNLELWNAGISYHKFSKNHGFAEKILEFLDDKRRSEVGNDELFLKVEQAAK